ncbi:MAG TPA: metallophosphoesterase [Bryobacteraceae bacterium]|nr:metallophosphoesterase [Bryobacteraceae bacterium]HOL72070.1 metallophosphoesterase [Bryobacteraceae bacterium]HOQ46349.1 metallophosphoesterase [Bryobacteraceae bacterium]HPQ13814.1 metallophosphoesterase [Bryobacteraceae bacterium]HPU72214.1 metallophosphoesterase [Bryobacteraceae bacterium]
MGQLRQFRNGKLSIWQSAADSVVAARTGAPGRPDPEDPIMGAAIELAARIDAGETLRVASLASPAMMDPAEGVLYCARLAMALGEAKAAARVRDVERFQEELDPETGLCDAEWTEIAEKYAAGLVFHFGDVPYRRHRSLSDFVIEDQLPANARVAIVSQLGTGSSGAIRVLKQIAAKKPDVLIHLGDIYYSGTPYEVERYFLAPLREHLDLSQARCFSLCGNHDVYSDGAGYYDTLLPALSQPASYFCLRNDYWQFIALDTGLRARVPGRSPTYLEHSEAEWLRDKMRTAGNRQTVLLSHHQLFSAFESTGETYYNDTLYAQMADVIEHVALWFWGHEHRLTIYDAFDPLKPGLERARSIGRGVEGSAAAPVFPEVRIRHHEELPEDAYGYAIMELQDAGARIEYFIDTGEGKPLFEETIGAVALRAT